MSIARQRRRFEIYPELTHHMMKQNPGRKNRWRWRLLAANNRVVADSGYSYESILATRKAVKRVRSMVSFAGVIVINAKGRVEYEA